MKYSTSKQLTRLTLYLQGRGRLLNKTAPAKLSDVISDLGKCMPAEFAIWQSQNTSKQGRLKKWAIVETACQYLDVDLSNPGRKRLEAVIMSRGQDPLSPGQRKTQEKAIKNNIAGRRDFVVSSGFLESYDWRQLRMIAIKRYGARCQCCGASPATGAVINVDHIKPRRLFPHLALSLDNLQVLCHDCNHGKGNWDMTDWRDVPEHELSDEQKAHLRDV